MVVAEAAGARGMVLGQVQDIAAETARVPLNLSQITQLQANKTGALIEASVPLGALASGHADADNLAPPSQYARAPGPAFQVQAVDLDTQTFQGFVEPIG